MRAAAFSTSAPALFQDLILNAAASFQRGSQAEEDSSSYGNRKCKQQRAHIDSGGDNTRQRGDAEGDDYPKQKRSEQQAEQAAEERKKQTFREQLPNDPAYSRAQCYANGNLFLPRGAAHQQQAGNISAHQQKHKSYGAHENPQRCFYVADSFFKQRMKD